MPYTTRKSSSAAKHETMRRRQVRRHKYGN